MRKLAAVAIPFCTAVFLAVYCLPDRLLLPAALFCALPALSGPLFRGRRRLQIILIPLGLAGGLAWTALYGLIWYVPAAELAGKTLPVTVQVLDWPVSNDYGISMEVKLTTSDGVSCKALLYDTGHGCASAAPGDVIRLTASLRTADTIAGKHTESYRSKGIFLRAYASSKVDAITVPDRIPVLLWPRYWARTIQARISAAFDETTAPLMTALITGDQSLLSGALVSAIRRVGLSHVVVVSGMHVSFLAGLTALLLGRNPRRTALGTMLILLAFAGIAGFTPSVLRAVFLQGFLLLAPLFGRQNDKATSLSFALMLLLAANPYAIAGIGLQLSFAAVTGIYLVTGPLQRRLTARLPRSPETWPIRLQCHLLRFLAANLSTTAGALLFTTPLIAYYFRSLSLIAPLSNLLCLWAVSDAFLGGLITALTGMLLPELAAVLASIAALPARFVLWLVPILAKFPFAAVPVESVYLVVWLLLVYGIAALYLLWRGAKKRPVLPLCLCTLSLCAALALTALSKVGGTLALTVLDVGQGQSVALYSKDTVALIDCGGTGLTDPGDASADYVQSLGLNRVDLFILTHFHSDHAGGVLQLLERLAVDTMVLPDVTPEDPFRQALEQAARTRGTKLVYLGRRNQTVTFGGAELTLYAPLGSGSTNEEGLSVLISAGHFRALLTGDMDDTIEKRLVKYGELPDIDLLVAGHHGSKYASSQALLEAVTPEYAVISVGYNTYGHPAPETLRRLDEAGCAIYRTDWMGDVTFLIPNKGGSVHGSKTESR